jgi:hypothetical protein
VPDLITVTSPARLDLQAKGSGVFRAVPLAVAASRRVLVHFFRSSCLIVVLFANPNSPAAKAAWHCAPPWQESQRAISNVDVDHTS